jgi:hypothetical protein
MQLMVFNKVKFKQLLNLHNLPKIHNQIVKMIIILVNWLHNKQIILVNLV